MTSVFSPSTANFAPGFHMLDERLMRELQSIVNRVAAPARSSADRRRPTRTGGKQRDSLARVYRRGRPGSRRYRQWENAYHLEANLSASESSQTDDDDLAWEPEFDPSFGAFAFMFEDDNLALFEPFLDTTEEAEMAFLTGACDGDGEDDAEGSANDADSLVDEFFVVGSDCHALPPVPAPLDAPAAFARVRPRGRRVLQQHHDSAMLQMIDLALFHFVTEDPLERCFADKPEHLEFMLDDAFHRNLLHLACEYYGLVSYSTAASGCARRTTVRHHPVRLRAPAVPLRCHLEAPGEWAHVDEMDVDSVGMTVYK